MQRLIIMRIIHIIKINYKKQHQLHQLQLLLLRQQQINNHVLTFHDINLVAVVILEIVLHRCRSSVNQLLLLLLLIIIDITKIKIVLHINIIIDIIIIIVETITTTMTMKG